MFEQKTRNEAAPAFGEVFGIPIGHVLRQVSSAPVAGARAGRPRWEHEEYDPQHGLVAVYESWLREDGGLAFVKYSPHGWVLSVSGRIAAAAASQAANSVSGGHVDEGLHGPLRVSGVGRGSLIAAYAKPPMLAT